METFDSKTSGPLSPKSQSKKISWVRKLLRAGLAFCGVLLITFLVLLVMSFQSSSDIQTFQKNLENGELKDTTPSLNPVRWLQASWRRGDAEKFREAVENYNGSVEPLKALYPEAVVYLAYNPKSSETLSMVARFYFLSGSRLSAERLALKAVALNPFDITARRSPVLCQALHTDQQERLMAATWEIIELQKQWTKYFLKVKGREKFYLYVVDLLSKILPLKSASSNWGFAITLSESENQERLRSLEKEEDWLKYRYAFGLFLTDPLHWKEDAHDCLDDESVKTDPFNLEYQCVVESWVAEWMENPDRIQAALQRLKAVKLPDSISQNRLQDYTSLFESVKGYDKQQNALKVYDCLHPVDPVWTRYENDALQLPDTFQPSSPEPEGGNDSIDWLDKIATGEQSPAPGRTKEDYTYPKFAEVKKTIDESLRSSSTMPVCPILLPLRDGEGRYTPLGAYLSVQGMCLACFPGKQILNFWSPFSVYSSWRLFSHWEGEYPFQFLLQEIKAQTNAESYAEGTLIRKKEGWEITLQFKGGSQNATYVKYFKKDQLHLVPGWMAESLHAWLGTRLSKVQKKAMKKPIFNDDKSLEQGLVLENFGWNTNFDVPGWDGIAKKNSGSSFILARDYSSQRYIEGIQNLMPMEALVQRIPKDDLARYMLGKLYNEEAMYGKSLKIQFDLLAKDQTNTGYYYDIASNLEALGDYANVRYLYEKMATRFPNNPQVQEAIGQFYVNYAWVARGNGWANSVSPWNFFLFKKRLALARTYLEKALALNLQDSRIYSELLEVGKGQNWKKEELDKIFNQGVSVDPDYYSIYSSRMDMTMEKWGGSNEEMMAFAHKWQARQPWLVELALKEQANNQTDGKELEVNRYLGSPKVWPELNRAYQSFFEKVSMDDYPTWVLYAWDAASTDKVQDFLTFLRAQAEKDEVVRYFTPYLVELVYEYRAQVIGWDHTGQLYLNTKEVWPEIYNATLQVMKQDPDNYVFLNHQAFAFTGWGRFKSARKVFNALGNHWAPKAGTKEKFDRYKRIAFHKEEPSWHLCLSTADQAAER